MIDELPVQLTDEQQEMVKEKAEEMGIAVGTMGKTTMLGLILEAHAGQIEQLGREMRELRGICEALHGAILGHEYGSQD